MPTQRTEERETYVTQQLLGLVLVTFDLGSLLFSHVQSLIGLGDRANVAGQSAAEAAARTTANGAAIRHVVAAHLQIQPGHGRTERLQLLVQPHQRFLVPLLGLVDGGAILRQQILGVLAETFSVS